MSAVLRIALLTQGGEQRETQLETAKKPGNALAGHLAHRDRPTASGQHSHSSHRYYTGSARYRCWCFDPAWSVSGSVSASGVLMSDWNPEGSQAAYHSLRRPGVPRPLHHLGPLSPGRE